MEFSLLTIHISILLVTIGIILYSDHEAFLYMRGKKATLNLYRMQILHKLVWAGLLGMIATGFTMFLPMREYLLQQPEFLIKISFVAMLVLNAFFIGKLMPLSATKPFAELLPKEKRSLFISGALSTIGWLGAITMAIILFE
jgi:hypothetical protein